MFLIRALSSFILMFLVMPCALAECARNEHGVFEEMTCAVDAVTVADQDLNSTYKRLMKSLGASERASLVKSQRAWLAFVEANAQFIYAIEGDGADGRLVVVNAREAYTRARSKELQVWLPK